MFLDQALLQEWQEIQGEFEGLVERVGLLGEVMQTDALHQQVAELSRHAEELQQTAKTRLLTLQDAAKVIQITHITTNWSVACVQLGWLIYLILCEILR